MEKIKRLKKNKKMKKRAKKIKNVFLFTFLFNGIYAFLTLLFILISWSSYELNIQFINSILYLGVLFFTPLIFIWDVYFYKTRLKKSYKLLFPLVGFIYIFYLNPLDVFNAANNWKTIEVLHENKENPNIKVEVQEKKLLTSNRIETRTVVVNNLSKYLKKIKKYHKDHIKNTEWNKIEN